MTTYLFIHGTACEWATKLSGERFSTLDIKTVEDQADPNDTFYKASYEEYLLDKITREIDKPAHAAVHTIVIDKDLNLQGWNRAIELAAHISCSIFEKCALNSAAIVLTDKDDFRADDPSLKHVMINNILQTGGIYFRRHNQLFAVDEQELEHPIERMLGTLKWDENRTLNLQIPHDNRHKSANEWGVVRLASNFGLTSIPAFKQPRHLYFKFISSYLSAPSTAADTSLHGLFRKVLLIDDNGNEGWGNLLREVFKCPVDVCISLAEVQAMKTKPADFQSYDLVLLDLYLEKGKSDDTHAIQLLQYLKKTFPQIPVLVFTASDKAWNLDKILEQGADAMYVKESPLFYNDTAYSQRNVRDFKTSIEYIHKKYAVLKPYWNAIESILGNGEFQSIDDTRRKLRSRIAERLHMFFGLLKKGYEQWDYDKNTFFYSDYELAFMTLWSVLNEIQEAFYDKDDRTPIRGLKNLEGVLIEKQFGSTDDIYPIPGSNWKVKGQPEYFVKQEFEFAGFDTQGVPITMITGSRITYRLKQKGDVTCNLLRAKNPPYYSLGVDTSRGAQALRELSNQIAFLILTKNNLRSNANLQNYLTLLYNLSDIRNHLFLTHGDSKQPYYSMTEQAKRNQPGYQMDPRQNIKQLFELVAFLLTGKDMRVGV